MSRTKTLTSWMVSMLVMGLVEAGDADQRT